MLSGRTSLIVGEQRAELVGHQSYTKVDGEQRLVLDRGTRSYDTLRQGFSMPERAASSDRQIPCCSGWGLSRMRTAE
jgi:hypothetical protein